MKKAIISLYIILIGMCSFAHAQSSDHLVFKGVPIDGTLEAYVSKMKQNGFTLLQTGRWNGILIFDNRNNEDQYENHRIGK